MMRWHAVVVGFCCGLGLAAAQGGEDPWPVLSNLRQVNNLQVQPPVKLARDDAALLGRLQRSVGPWLEKVMGEPDARNSLNAAWLKDRLDQDPMWRSRVPAPYGDISFNIQEDSRLKGWRWISLQTSVPGGTDTQLYVFHRQQGRYRLLWQDDWDLRGQIKRSRHAFEIAVQPIRGRKGAAIALFHISPWCEPTRQPSTWRNGHFRILEIQPDGVHRLMHSSEQELWIGQTTTLFKPCLRAWGRSSFRLCNRVESMDMIRHHRTRVLRVGMQAEGPKSDVVPRSPEDCVEEWVSLCEEGARKLQVNGDSPGLAAVHGLELDDKCSALVPFTTARGQRYALWSPRRKAWRVRMVTEDARQVLFWVARTPLGYRIADAKLKGE